MTRNLPRWLVIQRELHCAWCALPLDIHEATLDHLHPRKMRGSREQFNLVPACWTCNYHRGHKTLAVWVDRCVQSYGGIPRPTVLFLALLHGARPKWAKAQGVTVPWLYHLPTIEPLWGPPLAPQPFLDADEVRILTLIAEGLTFQQIAGELGRGGRDRIKRRARTIRHRFGVASTSEAIEAARAQGLLEKAALSREPR